ncbi:MAG: WD40 repeat domain-containing protein [Planctomycetales bacterium]|nr:WD40 repeat domain-containing protein [Planctomycetales bacterium]
MWQGLSSRNRAITCMMVASLLGQWNVASAADATERPTILQKYDGHLGTYAASGRFLAYVDTANRLRVEEVEDEIAIDPKEVDRLINALDSERFHERNEAYTKLRQLGRLVRHQLDERQALGDRNSLEVQERLKSLQDAITLSSLSNQQGNIQRLAVSPNDELVAVGGNDRTVTIWRSSSVQRESIISAFDSSIRALAFSPDSESLAIGTGNGAIYLYHISRQTLSAPLLGHASAVLDLAFSPDQKRLYSTGGSDKRVGIWSLGTNANGDDKAHKKWLLAHEDVVRCLAVSPDGETVVSGGYDKTLILWDTTSQQVAARLTGHSGTIRDISFISSNHFISASDDGTVRLWSLDASESLATLNPRVDGISSVSLHPSKPQIAISGASDRLLTLKWDVAKSLSR